MNTRESMYRRLRTNGDEVDLGDDRLGLNTKRAVKRGYARKTRRQARVALRTGRYGD